MELVLVKNKTNVSIYQGKLEFEGQDYYFFATVVEGNIVDMVVHTLDETEMVMLPINEETKDALFNRLVEDYVAERV